MDMACQLDVSCQPDEAEEMSSVLLQTDSVRPGSLQAVLLESMVAGGAHHRDAGVQVPGFASQQMPGVEVRGHSPMLRAAPGQPGDAHEEKFFALWSQLTRQAKHAEELGWQVVQRSKQGSAQRIVLHRRVTPEGQESDELVLEHSRHGGGEKWKVEQTRRAAPDGPCDETPPPRLPCETTTTITPWETTTTITTTTLLETTTTTTPCKAVTTTMPCGAYAVEPVTPSGQPAAMWPLGS